MPGRRLESGAGPVELDSVQKCTRFARDVGKLAVAPLGQLGLPAIVFSKWAMHVSTVGDEGQLVNECTRPNCRQKDMCMR